MNKSNKTILIIALAVVGVVLFLFFGGWIMNGSIMNGGMMRHDGFMRQGVTGGFGWILIPILLSLGLGILIGWLAFAKKN